MEEQKQELGVQGAAGRQNHTGSGDVDLLAAGCLEVSHLTTVEMKMLQKKS